MLAACLLKCGDDVEGALKLYETVRLPRTTQIQTGSWDNKTRFHMPDGPAQEERDDAHGQGSDRLGLQGGRLGLRSRRREPGSQPQRAQNPGH